MKQLGKALLTLWSIVDVESQKNRMIEAAILAPDRNVVCGHGTSLLLPDSYR